MTINSAKHLTNQRTAARERLALSAVIGTAVAFAGGGVAMAIMCDDAHWVNRAGAAIVAVQGVAAIIEFARRRRLQEVVAMSSGNDGVNSGSGMSDRDHKRQARRTHLLVMEAEHAERLTFDVVVGLAVIGELLHGFGDLLLHALH
jgi:hypothetical protein